MADNITATELIAQCRLDAEIPSSITDANILRWINRGAKRLNALVYSLNPRWAMSSGTVTLTGTETYSLPTDLYKPKAFFLGSGDDIRRIYEVDISQRSVYLTSSNDWNAVYYLRGDSQISILPSSTTGTLTVFYLPAFVSISGTDTFNGHMGWEDFIVSYVGLRFARRMAENTKPWKDELLDWERQYGSEIANMNLSQPAMARNISYDQALESNSALWR